MGLNASHMFAQAEAIESTMSPFGRAGYYDPQNQVNQLASIVVAVLATHKLPPTTPRLSQTVATGLGHIGGGAATAEQVLAQAQRWLGQGYREIAPGVYRSADNTRQFRMTLSDLTDVRQGAHVHFEAIGADGRTILENSHVGITNP
jgi:hypothetical protein